MEAIVVKKRHTIKKSEGSRVQRALADEIGAAEEQFRSKNIEVVETNSPFTLYLIDKRPLLMEVDGRVFTTVRGAVERPFAERRITVDSGAVPYVMNGADIMRPGVVGVSPDIKKDAPCVIAEERHGKPLAIGIALYDAADLLAMEKGKVVKMLHRVGDDVWNLEL